MRRLITDDKRIIINNDGTLDYWDITKRKQEKYYYYVNGGANGIHCWPKMNIKEDGTDWFLEENEDENDKKW